MKKPERVLILSTVWPEPNSSAAGVRQEFWIQFFRDWGCEVYLASASQLKAPGMWGYYSPQPGVHLVPIDLNRSESYEKLGEIQPDVVMFDRFLLEEQFGHAIQDYCAQALWILETQDLHFIRKAREVWIKKLKDEVDLSDLKFYENLHLTDEPMALRETASLWRVDSSLIISTFEMNYLKRTWNFFEPKIKYVPFLWNEPKLENKAAWVGSSAKSFQNRRGFSFIANYRHTPNLDGILWSHRAIWPLIRKKIPQAEVHWYGAYMPHEISKLHEPSYGVHVHGVADVLDEVFQGVRVNIAPLRAGAGIKGKVLEGFRRGIPCVATPIASEGLCDLDFEFPGKIAFNAHDFAEACIKLHENEELWVQAQERASTLMLEKHNAHAWTQNLRDYFLNLMTLKEQGELPQWMSKILRSELSNSRKYFARWIEEKEKRTKVRL